MEVTRKRIFQGGTSRLSVGTVLNELGFKHRVRWEVAKPVIKKLIVSARRSGDTQQEIMLNGIYSYLKTKLRRTCLQPGCQLPVKPAYQRCYLHALEHRFYRKEVADERVTVGV